MKSREQSRAKKAVKKKKTGTAARTNAKARAGNGKKSKKPESTPAPQRVTPDPLVFKMGLPDVAIRHSSPVVPDPLHFSLTAPPIEILRFFLDKPRGALKQIRAIPFHDMATREAEAAKLKKLMPGLTEQAWRNDYRNRLLTELRKGQVDCLWSWLHGFGPRGLALALAESEIVSLLEGWWIDAPILHDAEAKQQLLKTLERVSKPRFPRDPQLTATEATQRTAANNRRLRREYQQRGRTPRGEK